MRTRPSHRNRPGRRWRAGAAVGWLLAATALAGCGDAQTVEPAEYAQQLFVGANDERTEAGLEPLAWSQCLEQVALERAQAVEDSGELVHAPLPATCHPGATTGENLSRGEQSAQETVERWMASAGHEANIVNSDFVEVGVACVLTDGKPQQMACSWVAEGGSPQGLE